MKKLVCPECKNEVDLSQKPDTNMGDIVECNSCGITLEIVNTEGEQMEAEIADEGK